MNVIPFISTCKASLAPTRWGRVVHPPAGRAHPREPRQSAAWSPACPHSWTGCWSTTCLGGKKVQTDDTFIMSWRVLTLSGPEGDSQVLRSHHVVYWWSGFWLTHGWGRCRDRWGWRVCCPWEHLSWSHGERHEESQCHAPATTEKKEDQSLKIKRYRFPQLYWDKVYVSKHFKC